MILRQMERRPWRTLLSVGGVAAAVAIVILGNFFRDAIDTIVDSQFNVAMRNDVAVWTFEPWPNAAAPNCCACPACVRPSRRASCLVTLVNGHRRERARSAVMPPRPTCTAWSTSTTTCCR
jgi:putative ABC transport system permease protein